MAASEPVVAAHTAAVDHINDVLIRLQDETLKPYRARIERLTLVIAEFANGMDCRATTPDINGDTCGVTFTCGSCRRKAELLAILKEKHDAV
jgi:hypothetical protein